MTVAQQDFADVEQMAKAYRKEKALPIRSDVAVAVMLFLGRPTKVCLLPLFHLSYDRIQDIIKDPVEIELELAAHGKTLNNMA